MGKSSIQRHATKKKQQPNTLASITIKGFFSAMVAGIMQR